MLHEILFRLCEKIVSVASPHLKCLFFFHTLYTYGQCFSGYYNHIQSRVATLLIFGPACSENKYLAFLPPPGVKDLR